MLRTAIARRRSSSTATCVRVLDRELGVRPLDETTALYYAVLEGTFTAAPAVEPPATARRARARLRLWSDEPPTWARSRGRTPESAPTVGSRSSSARRASGRRASCASCSTASASRAVTARCFEEEAELAYGVVSGLLRDLLACRRSLSRSRRGGSTRSPACFPSSALRPSGPSTARRRRSGSTRRSASSSGGYRERCSSTTHTGPTRRRCGCCFSLRGDWRAGPCSCCSRGSPRPSAPTTPSGGCPPSAAPSS